MIKAVLISAAAGFSLPYLIDIAIPGIPPCQINSLPLETGLRCPSSPVHDTIFSSQIVNRSQKADKLDVLHTGQQAIDPMRNTGQKIIMPESKIKLGCERPFSSAVRTSVIVGRCLAAEQLNRATS
jgi:hypothetical protein